MSPVNDVIHTFKYFLQNGTFVKRCFNTSIENIVEKYFYYKLCFKKMVNIKARKQYFKKRPLGFLAFLHDGDIFETLLNNEIKNVAMKSFKPYLRQLKDSSFKYKFTMITTNNYIIAFKNQPLKQSLKV